MKFIDEIPFPVGSKERKRALNRRHYERHKSRYVERTRVWREENRERHAETSRRYHNSVTGRARHLLNSARNRTGECLIPLEWVAERLEAGRCEITGLPFVLSSVDGDRHPYAPSLDRKDCSKGYTTENCRLVLWAINMAFSNWGEEVFREIAKHLLVPLEYDL